MGQNSGYVPTESDFLRLSVQLLAGTCDGAASIDGVGFNKFDSYTGHRLADKADWTDKEKRYAWHMLKKYRKQLARLGIDYDSIPEPPPCTTPIGKSGGMNLVYSKDNNFIIKFPYNYQIVEAVKKLPKRKYDVQTKTWSVPKEVEVVEPLLSFLHKEEFECTEEVMREIQELIVDFEAKIKASQATTAEIEVPTLNGILRPFQKAGVAYASQNRKCIIADEMGLGKTVQAIATVEYLKGYPALIICPASLKLNWKQEYKAWLPDKKVVVLGGHNATNSDKADVYIINYDILVNWLKVLNSINFKSVISDEFHYCKNPKTKRTKAVKILAAKAQNVIGLTGTPVLNRPIELVSQLEIIGKLKNFGGYWDFARRYCGAYHDGYHWNFNGASNLEELNKKLRANCYIRRNKSEVLKELPSKQRIIIPLDINNRKEYQEAQDDLIKWLKKESINDEEFVESIKHLKKEEQKAKINARANSVEQKTRRAEQLIKIETLKQLAVKGKLGVVKQWIEDFLESGEKLVVFANHINVQHELLSLFPSAAHVLGGDSSEERQRNITRFQTEDDCKLIVCSLVAAGVGITLTSSSNVAFVELGWTPSLHNQAEDRIHRLGQQRSCTAWYLLANNTIEYDIMNLINQKRKVTTAVHDGEQADKISVMKELIEKLIGGTK